MSRRWPMLRLKLENEGRTVCWIGPLSGFQMFHQVLVQWTWIDPKSRPLVFVLEPVLRPREGEAFVDVPHLQFDSSSPEDSALCLYDPDEGEWNPTMLIADTTVPWASEWLHHYELWHADGVWYGPNAPGPISVGEINRARTMANGELPG